MEVHKHPHHISHKKRFGEYLLEFLMLFLAVYLGFLAENVREINVEKHREKQYMGSMVRDLELDTIFFSSVLKYNRNKINLIDSVIVFFGLNTGEKVPVQIYQDAFSLIKSNSFFQNSGTIEQLKNSGGLRLVRQRIVVDSIQAYDQQMRRLVIRDKLEVDESIKDIDLLQKVFDGEMLTKLYVDSLYKKSSFHPGSLVSVNRRALGEYLNHLIEYRFLMDADIKLRDRIAARATNLLLLIQKSYHLKNGEQE